MYARNSSVEFGSKKKSGSERACRWDVAQPFEQNFWDLDFGINVRPQFSHATAVFTGSPHRESILYALFSWASLQKY